MSDSPERIWAAPGHYAPWIKGVWDIVRDGDGDVEYIRADIAEARIAELEAEVGRLRGHLDNAVAHHEAVRIVFLEKTGDHEVVEEAKMAVARWRAALNALQDQGKD